MDKSSVTALGMVSADVHELYFRHRYARDSPTTDRWKILSGDAAAMREAVREVEVPGIARRWVSAIDRFLAAVVRGWLVGKPSDDQDRAITVAKLEIDAECRRFQMEATLLFPASSGNSDARDGDVSE